MSLLGVFPRFNKFLCCIDLQVGSIIIGIILLAFHSIEFARYIVNFSDGGYQLKDEWLPLVLYTLGVILALYLLLGAVKRNATWMSYYLYFKLFYMVYIIFVIVMNVVDGKNIKDFTDQIIILCIEFYFWLCVNSYRSYESIGGD